MACKYTYNGQTYTKDEFYSLVRTTMVQPRTVQKYEKVLFPNGNTASKVEGHTTLEEFKKEKENRIKQLENNIKRLDSEKKQEISDSVFKEVNKLTGKTKEEILKDLNKTFDDGIKANQDEINQLKQELERVEKEGFGALRPIYNFYENTVTNILNKQFGKENVKQITDEYGNTWNEIDLSNEKIQLQTKNILLSKDKTTSNQIEITIGNKKYRKGVYSFKEIFDAIGDSYANKLLKMLYELSNQNIDDMKVEIVDGITEAGHFDNGIIRININSLNPDTVFTHEVIHALTALKLVYWKKNSPKVYKDMEKIWIDSKTILDPNNTRYEFSSIDEFYAALSKQSFVEELASIKDNSFIGKLIQMFKDMLSKLGIKVEGTLAERALNNLTNIVQKDLNQTEIKPGVPQLEFEQSEPTKSIKDIVRDSILNEDEILPIEYARGILQMFNYLPIVQNRSAGNVNILANSVSLGMESDFWEEFSNTIFNSYPRADLLETVSNITLGKIIENNQSFFEPNEETAPEMPVDLPTFKEKMIGNAISKEDLNLIQGFYEANKLNPRNC